MEKKYRQRHLKAARFKGYCRLPKPFYTSFTSNLSSSERRFLIFCFVVLVDWDPKHSHIHTFGSFDLSNEDIGFLYGCSASAVSKLKSSLITKHYLYKRVGGRVAFKGFGFLRKNPSISGPNKLLETLEKSKAQDKKFLQYLEKNDILINIEFLEYHGIPTDGETLQDYKAIICSFNDYFKDSTNSPTNDLDIDELIDSIERGGAY